MSPRSLSTAINTGLFLISSLASQAGVVFTIETTEGGNTETSRMQAQDNALAMEAEGGPRNAEMIFHGDRREMVIIDHEDRAYMVFDQAMMQEMAGQLKAAAAQMEQAMAGMPEAARQRMQEMQRNGTMPGMPGMAGGEQQPPLEVRKTDRRETLHGYRCTATEMVRDGRVVRELWVTDWDNVPGGEDISGLFQGMAGFMSEMAETFRGSMGAQFGGQMFDEAFAAMESIDGFPVVTREFGPDGEVERESVLKSSEEQELDPQVFTPPANYRKRSMSGR